MDEPVVEGFVHGDLIPGNLLVDGGRLGAIIDWGGAGRGGILDLVQQSGPYRSRLVLATTAKFYHELLCFAMVQVRLQ